VLEPDYFNMGLTLADLNDEGTVTEIREELMPLTIVGKMQSMNSTKERYRNGISREYRAFTGLK